LQKYYQHHFNVVQLWELLGNGIMSAWSYQNKLAIPETQSKRDFVGGLSRLELGYAKDVYKLILLLFTLKLKLRMVFSQI
jgi:hypothetical protein